MLKNFNKVLVFCVFSLLFLLSRDVAFAELNYVGQWGSIGTGEGQFGESYNLALDSEGNVYVADAANDRVQKFTADGEFLLEFEAPYAVGITVDFQDNIYVSSMLSNVIFKYSSDGEYITEFGNGFVASPIYLYADSSYLYASNANNNTISQFDLDGNFVDNWSSDEMSFPWGIDQMEEYGIFFVANFMTDYLQIFDSEHASGPTFNGYASPAGLAYDQEANVLYVANTGANNIVRWDVLNNEITSFGASGSGDGQFDTPTGVAIDGNGLVYVYELGNRRVQYFIDTEITPLSITEPSSSSGGSSPNSFASCTDAMPTNAPNLFSVLPQGLSAVLNFVPVSGSNSSYVISYGFDANADLFATSFNYSGTDVMSYSVNHLFPGIWYFKIRGQNGCMPGEWSEAKRVRIL